MTNSIPLGEGDMLRADIVRDLPNGQVWLDTPHDLLDGSTPAERIEAGDLEAVRSLYESILYIGIS